MKGRRPAWLIRLGLFLYDTLGGRKILPGARTLDLTRDPAGAALQPKFRHAYEYSDCWVEDSRLVSLNARDAVQRGAVVLTRTRVTSAVRMGDLWEVVTEGPSGTQTHTARALVNAGGPWVEDVIRNVVRINTAEGVRLVRGSHIVTRKLYDHDRCYFFQGTDGRIIFAIPYEQDFTLIGTTDQDHQGAPGEAGLHRCRARLSLGFCQPLFRQVGHRRRCGLDLFRRQAALQRWGQVGHGGNAGLCAVAGHQRRATC